MATILNQGSLQSMAHMLRGSFLSQALVLLLLILLLRYVVASWRVGLTPYEYLQIANRKNSEDGTTAVVMLTQGDEIFVAHAGDSRAVLVHRSGKVSVLTSDHKPNRPDERRRIQELGGSVVFWGVWRVEGILAVSRAIGDRMLKPFVVAEPEVKKFTRTESDHYVVIASDGVWDTISNDDAAQLALKHDDPQVAAQHIMEEAYARGSLDNISVMVVDLRAEKNECSTKDA
ncbi:hypothetical protein JM16_001733 [Phytophthora kernoviae]|uniref:PPM-type phosphatase domain-containing protein n=4 Tax=Phytophthora kernoviae TaxID=325452 RepID=A0A8T0M765_9STRA|nr:hypothetical protein JM16_001733 [Phytophthora kernoviae]